MSVEIVLTLTILLCSAGAAWLAMAMTTKRKQRRIKREMEQGVADYLAKGIRSWNAIMKTVDNEH